MFAVIQNPVSQDPASLDNLHDLVTPAASPVWPPAPGWYALAIALSVLVVWVVIKLVKSWYSNAYRRAALVELERIRTDAKQVDQRTKLVSQINRLLKRVALARWSRERVAGFSGPDWLDFLNRTGKSSLFSQSQINSLRDSAYSTRIRERITDQQLDELIDAAEWWIKNHQAGSTSDSEALGEEANSSS